MCSRVYHWSLLHWRSIQQKLAIFINNVAILNGFRGSFLGVKRPGREVNHLPSSTEVKDKSSYKSSRLRLHGVDRENFISYVAVHMNHNCDCKQVLTQEPVKYLPVFYLFIRKVTGSEGIPHWFCNQKDHYCDDKTW